MEGISNVDHGQVQRTHSHPLTAIVEKEYTLSELEHFLAFFPSHYTLNLPGTSLKFRHLLNEATLCLQSVPPKYSAPHLNLLGFLYSKQGNHKIALRYFRDAQSVDDKNLLSLSNEAHCHLRLGNHDLAMGCVRKLMSLTASSESLAADNRWMGESKADLGYTYNMLGLSNAAIRMFTTAIQYNKRNVNAHYGLALALFSLAQTRGKFQSNLKSADQLLHSALKEEPTYMPALTLQLRIKSLLKGLTDTQITYNFDAILKDEKLSCYANALVFRDLAMIQMGRKEYVGDFGALTLLNLSLEDEATSQTHFLLGKAHYGYWLMGTDEGKESKESMLTKVRACYSKAVTMSYNCRKDIILELARVEEEANENEAAHKLFKEAVSSEDLSIQECAYRRLASLETEETTKEMYLREAMRRSHLVRLSNDERNEFWDLVFQHTATIIEEKGSTQAFPWIMALMEAEHPKSESLVEVYNKEHHNNPINKDGTVESPSDKKAPSRKQCRSKAV